MITKMSCDVIWNTKMSCDVIWKAYQSFNFNVLMCWYMISSFSCGVSSFVFFLSWFDISPIIGGLKKRYSRNMSPSVITMMPFLLSKHKQNEPFSIGIDLWSREKSIFEVLKKINWKGILLDVSHLDTTSPKISHPFFFSCFVQCLFWIRHRFQESDAYGDRGGQGVEGPGGEDRTRGQRSETGQYNNNDRVFFLRIDICLGANLALDIPLSVFLPLPLPWVTPSFRSRAMYGFLYDGSVVLKKQIRNDANIKRKLRRWSKN